MTDKKEKKVLFFTSMVISILLGFIWFLDGVFVETISIIIAICLLAFFLYDVNGWFFKYKGLTCGTLSLVHIWGAGIIFFHTNVLILALLTFCFLYVRDKYLNYFGKEDI